jgi:hypothetical protein
MLLALTWGGRIFVDVRLLIKLNATKRVNFCSKQIVAKYFGEQVARLSMEARKADHITLFAYLLLSGDSLDAHTSY